MGDSPSMLGDAPGDFGCLVDLFNWDFEEEALLVEPRPLSIPSSKGNPIEGLPARILVVYYAIMLVLIARRHSGEHVYADNPGAPPLLTDRQALVVQTLCLLTLWAVVQSVKFTTCLLTPLVATVSRVARLFSWNVVTNDHVNPPAEEMLRVVTMRTSASVKPLDISDVCVSHKDAIQVDTDTDINTSPSATTATTASSSSQRESRTPSPAMECMLTLQLYEPDNPMLHSKQARFALDVLQRLVITAYIRLASNHWFAPNRSFSMESISSEEWMLINHPLQDPTGSLFLALLSVRRNRPKADSFLPPPYVGRLMEPIRREASARLSVALKFNQHWCQMPNYEYVRRLMGEFLVEDELPMYEYEWRHEANKLREVEAEHIIAEPLYSLQTQNPLTLAEHILYHKIQTREFNRLEVLAMRGSLFFLLGACMLNPTMDVLETLTLTITNQELAYALVSVMETLMKVRKSRAILYKAPHSIAVDKAALVIIDNALSKHANVLRAGPYMEQGEPHPVRTLLSKHSLRSARVVFSECLGNY